MNRIKTTRKTISIPRRVLQLAEKRAEQEYLSFSGYMRFLVVKDFREQNGNGQILPSEKVEGINS
jgi:hypothetical protein